MATRGLDGSQEQHDVQREQAWDAREREAAEEAAAAEEPADPAAVADELDEPIDLDVDPEPEPEPTAEVIEQVVGVPVNLNDASPLQPMFESGMLAKYVHEIPVSGKSEKVPMLSVDACNDLAIIYGITVKLDSIKLSEDQHSYMAQATASRVDANGLVVSRSAVKEQPIFAGKGRRNRHAYSTACSKACRNAIRAMIPTPVKQKLISEWRRAKAAFEEGQKRG